MSLLKAHMNAIENQLIATAQIPANTGHVLHRGTPREAFIRQYLESHISSNIAIGTGEIIDANSIPRAQRNQFDIVLYKKNYPKLDFGGGVSGFLNESVVATIEVKSILDQAAIDQSVNAAYNVKQLTSNKIGAFTSGWIPPKILNYVVAYSGPANMTTAHGWILNSHRNGNIPLPAWTAANKTSMPGTALDGVFVLNKGFIMLDNTPISLNTNNAIGTHTICDDVSGNILMLFLCLLNACNNLEGAYLNPLPYVANARYAQIKIV